MQYECEACEKPLETGWTACPFCSELFDEPVPEYLDEVTPPETAQHMRDDLAGNELPPLPIPSPLSVPFVAPVPMPPPLGLIASHPRL